MTKAEERKLKEQLRLQSMTSFERPFWENGILVAGMDEVGRGPLAGPVVAACVVMRKEPLIEGVKDSKKVSEHKRERLYDEIRANALAFGFGWEFQDVIDEINILEATKSAFAQAYNSMNCVCSDVFVDAVKNLKIDANQHPLIHGDAICYSIAAASILAKVERDRFMVRAAEKYPQYGFERNKGYGTG
ncbi:MAG: ribonuclease HII, partial [Clostridiales bacterium]|nr:ribonuclease HII [Clostridiales bacterium]